MNLSTRHTSANAMTSWNTAYNMTQSLSAQPVRMGVYSVPCGGTYARVMNQKQYELKDHLGNVRVTFSDRKEPQDCDNLGDGWVAVATSVNNYYSFGSLQPGRNWNSDNYRFGFNGKENDNEVKGTGNQQDYGMRIYDPRLGRFLSVDPLTKDYPWYTPYQFAGNKPIWCVDLDGLEDVEYSVIDYDYQTGLTRITLTVMPNTTVNSNNGQLLVHNSNTGHSFSVFPFSSTMNTNSGSSDFDQLFQIQQVPNPTVVDDSKDLVGDNVSSSYSFALDGSSPLMDQRTDGIRDGNGNVKWDGSAFSVYPVIPSYGVGGSLDVTQSDSQILGSINGDINSALSSLTQFGQGTNDVTNISIDLDNLLYQRLGNQLQSSLSSMFPNASINITSSTSGNSGAYGLSVEGAPVDLETL